LARHIYGERDGKLASVRKLAGIGYKVKEEV
jgi:hypothetical protein